MRSAPDVVTVRAPGVGADADAGEGAGAAEGRKKPAVSAAAAGLDKGSVIKGAREAPVASV